MCYTYKLFIDQKQEIITLLLCLCLVNIIWIAERGDRDHKNITFKISNAVLQYLEEICRGFGVKSANI